VLRRTIALASGASLLVLGTLGLIGGRIAASPSPMTGVVVGPQGAPVSGASVSTDDGRATTTDPAGRFTLPGPAAWLTVHAQGWLTRSRVGAPGDPVVVRLLQDRPGTITLAFGGDAMFGRRYFDPAEDGSMAGLLSSSSDTAAHLALLRQVAPLLRGADLTTVNLESPLADDPYPDPTQPRPAAFHPTKDYVFASSPVAARALAEVGVDVVGLANNHEYDRLQAGVGSTIEALEEAGFRPGHGFFGDGARARDAWVPAVREVDGQRVAFVGCTSITGTEHAVSYVADRHKGGAARCTAGALRTAVRHARSRSDVVVAMVHGGFEYDRQPSAAVRRLSEVARGAGAALVIDGHPHVVGGLRYDGGTLTAWTMGNLVFDQTLAATFDSYVLQVAVRHGHVVGAWADPFRIDGYVPTGVYGADADWVTRGAEALSEGPWVDDDGSLWLDVAGAARRTTASGTPGLIRIETGCAPGAGRDLLWTGDFEKRDLLPGAQPRLWNVVAGDAYRRSLGMAAHDGRVGVLLHRASSQASDVILMPTHRALVTEGDRLTLLVDLRAVHRDPDTSLQLSWYNDTKGGSQARTVIPLPVSDQWRTSRVDVTVPRHAVAVLPMIRLSPPDADVTQVAVDNVRLVDWDRQGCDYAQDGQATYDVALPPASAHPVTTPIPAHRVPATAPVGIPPYRGTSEE
jgi:poly-gamma-glutamate capsule biosynthesis protein CapA/YwtB (metallophosphatase superfamily)